MAMFGGSGVAVGIGAGEGEGVGAGLATAAPQHSAASNDTSKKICFKMSSLSSFRLARRKRLGLRDCHACAFACVTNSVSAGTMAKRSPTTSRSANSPIGTPASRLIATMVPALCMPTLCWIAPEIPTAK